LKMSAGSKGGWQSLQYSLNCTSSFGKVEYT
jgi:hypothetical protein